MPAPKGSKNGQKMKTDDIQLEAYHDYCDWVASGKSKDSWRWRKDNRLMCTWDTMEKYMREDPIKFPPIQMLAARCDAKAYWEKIVEDSAVGTNEKANTASLQMIMRNKFGWDKQNQEKDATAEQKLDALTTFFKAVSSKPLEADTKS